MIKAILFDFDGVLTTDKTGSYIIYKYISNMTGIDFGKLSQAYKKYNYELLYGKTTHKKIFFQMIMKNTAKILDAFS